MWCGTVGAYGVPAADALVLMTPSFRISAAYHDEIGGVCAFERDAHYTENGDDRSE
jgi:hypothetical protein